ncbi:DHH family phosphoesterase [Clostridium sp. MB40-C1]|uniref:DHH family phosphoesterase n=1 Tax=Clostridium sp. MB40-C1 TaxID=3070996 RepID=UPI0027DF0E65|nr:DHH family phosphoesterase [Clostridium sp. MB40-C1]WMJ80093.1 DHH family phosphoesterase [Clostridium sp. MB40-C1]
MEKKYFIPSDKFSLFIIGFLILVLFMFRHFYVAGIFSILYIVFLIYNFKIYNSKKDEWEKFIEGYISQMEISTRSIINSIPFPLTIISEKGNILWYNQNFFNIFEKGEILGKNINEIINEININRILNKDKKSFNYVKIRDKYYNIFVNIKDNREGTSDKNKTVFLYFSDVTNEVNAERYRSESEEAIILVEVDNLDDVLKTTLEDKSLLLSAEIERKLKNYGQNLNAMVTKYSSSKYIMVVHKKDINKEMEKNFDILDEIREINLGNKLTVTLSVGVGLGGQTPLENHNFAISAKELALSRGGDQVVVKNKDKLHFYGGKTKEVAKRTKVRARVIGHALVNTIKESSNVFVMGHTNQDIDSIGASMGVSNVVKALGKDCYIILDKVNCGIEKAVEKIKSENMYNGKFINQEKCLDIYDKNSLLILVDVNSKGYVHSKKIVEKINRKVIIDHHRKSTDAVEDTLLSYIEPYASSTCELVTEMFQYMLESPKKYIDSVTAEMLLAGIYVDTKNFYFKTGVRTFEAAAYLRQLGADIIEVKRMFSNDLETYLKKAKIISLANLEKNICITVCPPEIQDNVLAAQVADELLNITGVQVSFVLVKIKKDVFISGRSNGDINVQLIMESLGGGGHLNIAGAKLNNVSIDEAKEKLKNAIDKYLREGEE